MRPCLLEWFCAALQPFEARTLHRTIIRIILKFVNLTFTIMSTSTFPLITAPALRQLLYQDDIIIIDASGGPDAKKRYEKRHIEGARFIDLETQLADTSGDPARGGRHPLPAVTHFAETLSMLGITKSHRVVIYDDKSGANAAARLWWMLRAAGHPYVQVLDGGLQAAEEHGLPINDEPVIINPSGAYT